jgi:hypothetical protein
MKTEKSRYPDIGSINGRIIIFEHWASVINFLPSVEKHIYIITDDRLYDSKEWEKPEAFRPIFIEKMDEAIKSGKRIILMFYNPVVAFFTHEFVSLVEEKTKDKVLCLSFFHDDEETSSFHVEGIKNMLDFKFIIIKSMLHYYFIKKITVPFNYNIGVKYLADLFDELL